MRYFLISGKIIVNKSIRFQDSVCIRSNDLPSLIYIKSLLISSFESVFKQKAEEVSGVLIINLFEFTNELDYNTYNNLDITPVEKEMD